MLAVQTFLLLILLGFLKTQTTNGAILTNSHEFNDDTVNNTNTNLAVSMKLSALDKFQILQTIWNQIIQHRDTLNMDTVLSIHKLIYEHLIMPTTEDEIAEENTEILTEERLLTWDMHKFLCKIESLNANASDFEYLRQLSKSKRQVVAEKLHAEDLYQEIHAVIVEEYGPRLAHVLARHSSVDLKFFQQLIEKIYAYDPHALEKIYEYAIDQTYNFRWTHRLAGLLDLFGGNNKTHATHAIVVEAQLYLFWKFQGRRDINAAYMLNVGYYLYQYQAQSIFKNTAEAMLRMEKAIAMLPTTVSNLFSTSKKCLKNTRFEEYMYGSPTEIDQTRNFVFTWQSKTSDEYSVMKLPVTSNYNDDNEVILNIMLFSTSQNGYLFRDNSFVNHIVVRKQSDEVPENSTWNLSMKGNSIVLKQNDYLLCASNLYNVEGQRRWVDGEKETGLESGNCQWIVNNCPDN